MDEAKGVCKDRSRWRSVVSAYPHGKKGVSLCILLCRYVCMLHTVGFSTLGLALRVENLTTEITK